MKTQTLQGIHVPADLSNRRPNVRSVVLVALTIWLGLVLFFASQGAFVGRPDSPPLPIFVGVVIPLALFLAAYAGWKSFRDFVLTADLRLIAAIQGWRWAGLGFLSLYANGILPGLFALPAGLGDMAIGFTAPWIVLRLAGNPLFAGSRRFVIWNILGVVDLLVALSTATLSSGAFTGITALNGNVTTAAMTQLPLVFIPAFMVPFFTMLHLTALFQARQLARSHNGRVTLQG